LINGFKNNQYKKVVFLTGAGLSVAAGIPDFRSPKTGLYSQLQKYNLPFPEAVFAIDFYKKNPEPFMRLAKEYFKDEF
jgi:NAD-dependent SIR2 family protein deacetylase